MNEVLLEWREYRYFPYERDFARRETESVFRTQARGADDGLRISASSFDPHRADRLTYFARVATPSGETVVPRQVKLEATARLNGSGNRQATRYSAHGLHEYKGRFNPQVVRAIGNILGLEENAWILDPFCGSGTTLLECAHVGWNSIGVDRNPLAIQIANAKLRAIRHADRLSMVATRVVNALQDYAELSSVSDVSEAQICRRLGEEWTGELPAFSYLREWFAPPVLAQVVALQRVLRKHVKVLADRSVFETILSDHLRDASLQEPADLRIRRRKDPDPNYPLLDWFAEAAAERLARVARAQAALGDLNTSQAAVFGDNRCLQLDVPADGFDAVITSPPYETALPYIDTQRLSLIVFGHITPNQILSTEQQLTGCREISQRERRELETELTYGDRALPKEVTEVCQELLTAAAPEGNGFRRQNRPALTFRYFRHMASFFKNLVPLMRQDGKVAVVVGPSRTTLSGNEYVIDTPNLLTAIGRHLGYNVNTKVEMDTYQRYDLHQRNSIGSEMLIVFGAPGITGRSRPHRADVGRKPRRTATC